MKFNIYIFFGQFIIIFNKHNFYAKAIIGHNVRQAQSGEFSYVASLMRIEPGSQHMDGFHFCSGVLITRKDVITAAHCLEGEIMITVQIVVGTIDLRDGLVYFPFWWQSFHQWAVQHNVNLTYAWNDIANIRLLFKVSANIIPMRISRLSNTELSGADVIIAGWGLNNDHIIPDIMHIADLKIVENVVCEVRVERSVGVRYPIRENSLCTFVSPYVLIEQGDSGGPLLFRNRLVGLNNGVCPTSTGLNHERQINLHIGINAYRNYIIYMKTQ